MTTALAAHPYPLIRGGGLFLIFLGAGFLLAWLFQKYWIQFMVAGFVTGFTASGLSALLPSLGKPSLLQIAGLIVPILVELGLMYLVVSRCKDDERKLILGVLLVVGSHFVLMGIAHGPLMSLLGMLAAVNAATGLWLLPSVPTKVFGVVDAGLKLGFGLVLLLAYPAVTFT